MYQLTRVIVPSCLLALTACGGNAEGQPHGPATDDIATFAENVPDAPTMGTIGPVHYGFSPESLTRAEIQLELPPRFDSTVWATKLFSAERAPLLGGGSCRYGGSPAAQTCTAEKEDGLALALLERPIADYRGNFASGGIPASALRPDMLAGASGFCFTISAAGDGTDYCYYAVSERTLLVSRRFSERGAPDEPAFAEVLESLRIPPEPGERTS